MRFEIIGTDFLKVNEEDLESYYENQLETFFTLFDHETMIIHFIGSRYTEEEYMIGNTNDINEYIECLAIKEGVNLVKFESGNIGFVAYYNNYENGFEVMETACNI